MSATPPAAREEVGVGLAAAVNRAGTTSMPTDETRRHVRNATSRNRPATEPWRAGRGDPPPPALHGLCPAAHAGGDEGGEEEVRREGGALGFAPVVAGASRSEGVFSLETCA